ncbi:MAG TPA: penicillin-binding transpeptidase domain-containing protein, partial [Candidatus Polarisedimenticolaceae bacterium]|nr:penicillin-binding transpeptidase domain-containing protein [Candidatus Polarisedimenticolaceae bacterium]
EGAALVVRPVTGAIVAMVGGRDYGRSQFNRATQARRQPGSCFKPIVFAAGLEAAAEGRPDGLTPATLLEDQPLELVSGGKTWSPANYDREFRGIVTVRHALERSLNVPTVRAAQAVGLDRVVTTARRLGIASPMQPLPSLALGTAEVSPLELATAYAAFAAGGTRTTPWIIRAVLDGDGARMEAQTVERGPAVSAQTAFLLTDMLRGVFERGTARSATDYGFRGEAAGKTGTTDDTRDSWFVGYDDELFGLVWLGYDDNSRTGLTGATGALPIWVELMSRTAGAHRLSPEVPEGVVSRRIDAQTGELARSGCDEVIREYFIRGTEPLSDCHLHEGRFKRWFERILGRGERERGGKRRSG